MPTTTRAVEAALTALVLLAGCGSTPSGSPGPAVSTGEAMPAAASGARRPATTTTSEPETTAAPDSARVDELLAVLDAQLAAGTKALDDAGAAIDSGEGEVTP